jgi:hypothetical protein
MMSAIMLAVAPLPSLVPTKAFAQADEIVENVLTELGVDSNNQEDNSENEGGEEASASVDPTDQLNVDSNNQEDNSENEGGDNSVIVDPKVQASVQPDVNVNADTHVITDEDNCEDANDEVNQANIQGADQEGRSDGEVGEGSVYVSPKVQTSTQVGLNANVDTDVIFADCDVPSDEVNQANIQAADQEAGSDIGAGEGSSIIIPAEQRADVIGLNIGENTDVIRPLPFL